MTGTIQEWAAHCGIARYAADTRIKRHNIPIRDGKIDFDEADAIWAASQDARQVERSPSASKQTASHVSPLAALAIKRDMEKLRIDRANARMAEIEAAEAEGSVVAIGDVEAILSRLLSEIKTRLLSLGAKLAGELANEAEATHCSRIVDDEVIGILTELSDGLEIQIYTRGIEGLGSGVESRSANADAPAAAHGE